MGNIPINHVIYSMRQSFKNWPNHTYRISSSTRPGVYFPSDFVDPALERDWLLNGTGTYKALVYTIAKFVDDVIDSMASEGSDNYEKTSVISGHHIYKSVWTPSIEEELVVKAEDGNKHYKHAVAVMKNGCVVGHVPRCIFRVSWFFVKRGGHILCHVTGKRKLGPRGERCHSPVRMH